MIQLLLGLGLQEIIFLLVILVIQVLIAIGIIILGIKLYRRFKKKILRGV